MLSTDTPNCLRKDRTALSICASLHPGRQKRGSYSLDTGWIEMTSFKLWSLRFTTPSRLRHHSGRGDEEKLRQQILYSVTQCTVYQSAPYFQQIVRFRYACVYVISLTPIRIVWPTMGLPSWKSYCLTALSSDPYTEFYPKRTVKVEITDSKAFMPLSKSKAFTASNFAKLLIHQQHSGQLLLRLFFFSKLDESRVKFRLCP